MSSSIISDIKSWFNPQDKTNTHDSAILESANNPPLKLVDRYSAKIRMILGAMAISSAAYLWGAVHSQYESESLVNSVSSKVVRTLGKKPTIDTYGESQKEVLHLQGEKEGQKALMRNIIQTDAIVIDTWQKKYEWVLKEDSENKANIAKLHDTMQKTRKSLSSKNSIVHKDSAEIKRLKRENIVLTKRLAVLKSSSRPMGVNSDREPSNNQSEKEEEKISPPEKELSLGTDVGSTPDSPTAKVESEEYMSTQWGASVSDQELVKASPTSESPDTSIGTTDQEIKQEDTPVKTWGLWQQQDIPVWNEVLAEISQHEKTVSLPKSDEDIILDSRELAVIQEESQEMPVVRQEIHSGEYKDVWQWTSRMRTEIFAPASGYKKENPFKPDISAVRTNGEFMRPEKNREDEQVSDKSSEEKKMVLGWEVLTIQAQGKDNDEWASTSMEKEGLATKTESKSIKKVSNISYKQLKKLTQEIQAKLNIPEMEIHVQEYSREKFKVWVSYKGNISKSFFTTTKKHWKRLTPEGMETWAQETMNYLSCLETIKQAAEKESIHLKSGREVKNVSVKKNDLTLMVKEVGTWKIRLTFSNTAGSKEIFLLPLNILDKNTLDAIFKITKFKLQET